MTYQLNFYSTTAEKQRKVRIRRFTLLIYSVLWVVTSFFIFRMYSAQLNNARTYQKRVADLESKIITEEPRILHLEKKIQKRNELRELISLYVQENNRPLVWHARLIDFSRFLPPDLALTRISFSPSVDGNRPEISLDGYMIIKESEQDIYAVEQLRNALAGSLPTKFSYSRVSIDRNHIFKEGDHLKLFFTMGYYR